MRISITRLARRLRAQRADSSLSGTQMAVLAALAKHHAMSPRELADHEKVQPPSMTRVLAALEEKGLVSRSQHPTDRRQQIVTLTDEGQELLKQDRKRREAWLAQRLKELTPEERATLRQAVKILERLSQA
ncbi:MAG: MarR family transcriptional regulator [Streptosporangiales bacterium]|nr:MarR family transcriptional regulator [Streptosporangiales bacterium]